MSGSLSLLPPFLLLEAAERNGQHCRLTMREGGGQGVLIVLFRSGRPTMVFSPGDGRSLGEMLLDAGVIDHPLLSELLRRRATERGSLERLLRERTDLREEELQSFFDFQARIRLLEALAWRSGSFELERYNGDEESEFRINLPSFQTLDLRARARAQALAEVLPSLPAPPEHLLVRRRTGIFSPADEIQAAVLEATEEPKLVPQLVARLRRDDDLVLRAVLDLVSVRALTIQPRAAALPASSGPEAGERQFWAELLQTVVQRLRGAGRLSDPALWILVVGEGGGQARAFVDQLAGRHGVGEELPRPEARSMTVARAQVRLAHDATLCAVAVEPDSLSPGAIDPLLSRFDVLCAVRGEAETPRLDRLLEQLSPLRGPLVVGVALGKSSRRWPGSVSGVVRLAAGRQTFTRDLGAALLQVLHGAASQRS